jgi:hypothetical protein
MAQDQAAKPLLPGSVEAVKAIGRRADLQQGVGVRLAMLQQQIDCVCTIKAWPPHHGQQFGVGVGRCRHAGL